MKRLTRILVKVILIGVIISLTFTLIILGSLSYAFWGLKTPENATQCIALIHGLARSEHSFTLAEKYFTHRGYKTISIGYPSTEGTLDSMSQQVWDEIDTFCVGTEKTHVITHSLGGILTRYAIDQGIAQNFQHIVMLAPPNSGSEIVDLFATYGWFEWINGPTGIRLGTGESDIPASLPRADYSLGIIAGSVSLNPIYSFIVAGEDDGKVSLESAKLEGMSDYLVIPSSHSFIMNNPLALLEAEYYIEHGYFDHELGFVSSIFIFLGRIFL